MIGQHQILEEVKNITYKETHNSFIGTLIIEGLTLLQADFLGQFWANGPRVHIQRRLYDVDVTGCFLASDDGKVITGSFCLSFVDEKGETIKKGQKKYMEKFEQSFSQQMALFEEALENFLLDTEDGYVAYISLLESGKIKNTKDTIKFIRKFMRKINLRQEEDEKKSAEKFKKIRR